MPSTKGLEMLVRNTKLTDEDWFLLLEARRELIKPYLDKLTLPELGSLCCLRGEFHTYHEIRRDRPDVAQFDVVVQENSSFAALGVQGIFRGTEHNWSRLGKSFKYTDTDERHTVKVWGLARENFWVLVEIDVEDTGSASFFYTKAKTVKISRVDIRTIVKKTGEAPELMWRELGSGIREVIESRRKFYEEALKLERIVGAEELAVSLIQK